MREGLDRLEERTKRFAIATTKLSAQLERLPGLRNAASQLSRAGGSVASNHRAMRRWRSMKEFAAKLQIVCEESDECVLWLEVASGAGTTVPHELPAVMKEAIELRNIFAKARATTRGKM